MNFDDFNWLDCKGKVISEEYKYFAIDKNGSGYVYKIKPVVTHNRVWFDESFRTTSAKKFVNIFILAGDWQDSLVKRFLQLPNTVKPTPSKVLENNYNLSQIQNFHASLSYQLAFKKFMDEQ